MKSGLFLLMFISMAFVANLQDVRLSFQKAENSKEAATAFNALLQQELKIDKHVKLAYLGASETLIAKHAANPQEKIQLFRKGKEKIEQAVQGNYSQVEIRVIRLMVQSKSPAILGYRANISEDKQVIISNFSNLSPDLKKYINDIAKDRAVFSEEEQKLLK